MIFYTSFLNILLTNILLNYSFDIDAKVEKSDIVKKSLETMLLIVHQFAVSKLDKNFGKEESGLSQEGFDDESLVSI